MSSSAHRRFIESIPIGLIISEKEVGSILFPTLDGRFDYYGFKAKGKEANKWCEDLYLYYWERATEKVPKNLAELMF